MQRWSRLNERQLVLLTRIAAGDDPVTSDSPELAQSARALKERGLITMLRGGGKKWQAAITDAGAFYLEHGHHPDRPAKRPRTAVETSDSAEARVTEVSRSAARQGASRKHGASARTRGGEIGGPALIEQVLAAERFMRIPDPTPEERARYRRAFDAARTCAPAGYALKYSGRAKGDFFLGLLRVTGEDDAEWNRIRLQRSRTITDVDDVIAAVQADHSAFEVSEDVLPRVLSLLRLLAQEALRRHGDIAVSKKRRHPRPMLTVHGRTYEISFQEGEKQVRYVPPQRGQRRIYDWQRTTPAYRTEPSGELELRLSQGYSEKLEWSDSPKKTLEEQIDSIFRAVKKHAEKQERGRLTQEAERKRQKAERDRQLAERQRAEVEERDRRQQQWETALTEARAAAIQAARGQRFTTMFDKWLIAGQIRQFCTAFDEMAERCNEPTEAEKFRQWARWGEQEADSLDPTSGDRRGSAPEEFSVEPTGEELRPFLNGWSPNRPEKERTAQPPSQRSEAEPQRAFIDVRLDQGWRYGRPGRAQWWRR
ncbi:PE-PGRS family protein [Actinacidiphila sp. bgisy144]|uniref:PE-PGRS family protein n=1 Tax=Actinacidiphila sp. bgisy144 TaxID=3413791 RepID=UPI003EC110F0